MLIPLSINKIRLTGSVLIFVFILSTPVFAAKGRKKAYQVSARSAIFSNSTRGQRYYGKNIDLRVPPASTTKVMTVLLVLERLSLDQELTASARSANVQPSNIQVHPGEKFKVRDLLYAILLNSANDASIILAEGIAGSEAEFVKLMNARARALGAHHTHFINSNGLPIKGYQQYTTAYDMYLIFREAVKYDFFRDALRQPYKIIYSSGGRQVDLKSHNKILFKGWKNKIYGKTGYTRAAQSCFVGYVPKGDSICIIAVFGCSRRWTDIRHIVSRYGGISL